ncbi:MAG: class I SAM-dependent methyltransferase [Bacteroidota bacterium]
MLFQSNGLCPICKTPGENWCKTQDWEYRATTDWYTYLQCPFCQTLFIKEVLHDDLLNIYPPDYYSFSAKAGRSIFKLKDAWDRYYYKSLLKKIDAVSLSVLDIGGGTGEVLDSLKKADNRIGYTEIIDIDKGSAHTARQKGHVYTHSTIEKYTTDKKFHVILLLNIIEHVGNPVQIIEKAGGLLAEDGIIVIKTPNADSLDARLFRNHYWGGLHCPRHWVIFTDHSFKMMIKQSSLILKNIKFTQGAPFWSWSLLNLFRKKDIKQHKRPLIEHVLFAPLSVLFAIFDIARSIVSKTSQMFITLSK